MKETAPLEVLAELLTLAPFGRRLLKLIPAPPPKLKILAISLPTSKIDSMLSLGEGRI